MKTNQAANILEKLFQDMHDLTEQIETILYDHDCLSSSQDVISLSITIHQCNELMRDWIEFHS